MAALTFSKQGEVYVSNEVTVNKDYNLHLEREGGGVLKIEQKTAGTQFAECKLPPELTMWAGQVIDYDIAHGVYPKTIRVTSATNVTSGTLTETV